MNKFAVDYSTLEGHFNRKKAYRLSDVKDKIRKVAFDVVRFVDSDNIDGLWQIQHTDDGDYIVAMYDDGEEKTEKSSSDWSVLTDKRAENIHIFYKNTPVTKVASASLGVPADEVSFVCEYLPEKLASNKRLLVGLLSDLSSEDRKRLYEAHPEFNKMAKEMPPINQTPSPSPLPTPVPAPEPSPNVRARVCWDFGAEKGCGEYMSLEAAQDWADAQNEKYRAEYGRDTHWVELEADAGTEQR